jgi:serine/threonine-protein kinase HipA
MSESKLLSENGRSHFMTKRFDRLEGGEKLHMQSLCAIAHYDYNMAGAHSYESVIDIIRRIIKVDQRKALEQQFRRTVFNIVGRNQDDHTKNIAFLMNKKGEWSLSPAFDLVYNYNPDGQWTTQHQMSLNQKKSNFNRDDLIKFAGEADIKKIKAESIIDQIVNVFKNSEIYFREAGVFEDHIKEIKGNLRTDI